MIDGTLDDIMFDVRIVTDMVTTTWDNKKMG